MNAVKELLENSLDAGATRVAITVQVPSAGSECGLFSITVTDNGHGIWRDDLALLCERHATSKLSSVSDLGQVQTFGFRGEALASCSQVARVEVVTRRRRSDDAVSEEQVAWRAEYLQGKMQGTPEAVAGNPGTTIHVSARARVKALLQQMLNACTFHFIRFVICFILIEFAGKLYKSHRKSTPRSSTWSRPTLSIAPPRAAFL